MRNAAQVLTEAYERVAAAESTASAARTEAYERVAAAEAIAAAAREHALRVIKAQEEEVRFVFNDLFGCG